MKFKKEFYVDNVVYEFNVNDVNEAAFYVKSGFTNTGKMVGLDSYNFAEPNYEMGNIGGVNSIRVFSAAFKIIKEYLYKYKPPYIYISPTDDKRRRIYAKALSKLKDFRIESACGDILIFKI